MYSKRQTSFFMQGNLHYDYKIFKFSKPEIRYFRAKLCAQSDSYAPLGNGICEVYFFSLTTIRWKYFASGFQEALVRISETTAAWSVPKRRRRRLCILVLCTVQNGKTWHTRASTESTTLKPYLVPTEIQAENLLAMNECDRTTQTISAFTHQSEPTPYEKNNRLEYIWKRQQRKERKWKKKTDNMEES